MKLTNKMVSSLKIWVAIYPSITLLLYASAQLLSHLPFYLRTLVLTLVLVPWVVFIGLPVLEVIIRKVSQGKLNN